MSFHYLILYREKVKLWTIARKQNAFCFSLMHPASKLVLTAGHIIK